MGYEDLGECRRFPPRQSSLFSFITKYEHTRYLEERKDFEEGVTEAERVWNESQDEKLKKAGARLENIKKSLRTCKEQSVEHWEKELEAQEKEIERMRQGEEFVLEKYFRAGEPVYPGGFKARMGRWILASGKDFCGEWKAE